MPDADAPEVSSARQVIIAAGDLPLREAWYAALSRRGLRVAASASSQQAADLFARASPDVLVAGASLTDGTGWDLVARVRAFAPRLPIILVGGPPVPPELVGSESVQAHLPESTSPEALAAVVELCLASRTASGTARTTGTILLVDDDPRLRNIVREFLVLHGFTMRTAESGEAALQELAAAPVDAVLLDIRMRGMDGLVTLKKIHAARPALPVVIITSADDEAIRREALLLGARQYVLKPLHFDHLKDILVGALLTPDDRPACPRLNTQSPAS